MKLPQKWSQVRIDQYKLLNELKEEDFGSLFLYNCEVFSILMDVDVEEFDELTTDEFSLYTSQLKWMKSEPSKKYKHKIDKYTFKSFDKISLGEFIDLEHFFKLNYIQNIEKICAILYKQTSIDEWSNTIHEPYIYSLDERVEVFDELPITDVYGIIPEYLKFREEFLGVYENLFKQEIEGGDEEMDEEDKKEEEQEEALSRWSWESIIYNMSGGDLTKVDQLTDLPLTLVFNMISMKQDLEL